jgi:hypothetical protein
MGRKEEWGRSEWVRRRGGGLRKTVLPYRDPNARFLTSNLSRTSVGPLVRILQPFLETASKSPCGIKDLGEFKTNFKPALGCKSGVGSRWYQSSRIECPSPVSSWSRWVPNQSATSWPTKTWFQLPEPDLVGEWYRAKSCLAHQQDQPLHHMQQQSWAPTYTWNEAKNLTSIGGQKWTGATWTWACWAPRCFTGMAVLFHCMLDL